MDHVELPLLPNLADISDSSNSCNSGINGHLDNVCHPLSSKNQPEQEGFEPPEPLGSMVFKTTEANSQGESSTELTDPAESRLQTSLQTNPENGPNPGPNHPTDLAEIMAVWPHLPEHIKAAIMALIQASNKDNYND